MTKPKIALVHDWLNVKVGGAEEVLFEMAHIYPQADLFALIYNKSKFRPYLGERKVKTSFLQYFPRFIKRRPFLMLPFMQLAVNSLKFQGYDLIISNSSAWVKNVRIPEGTKHLCYCHSPARMLWDSWPGYLDSQKIGPFSFGPTSRFLVTYFASRLRLWDYYATARIDAIYGNSSYIVGRIKKYYGRDAGVLYPPVKKVNLQSQSEKQNFYLVLSVLSQYKNIDVVIEAFKQSRNVLIVAGSGPDETRLKMLASANENIVFTGRVSDEKKAQLMAQAKAFIFPSIEDFGITPVEAMSSATPVIALRGGGLEETIVDGKTGVFYDESTPAALNAAITKCDNITWSANALQNQAAKFSTSVFRDNIITLVAKILG